MNKIIYYILSIGFFFLMSCNTDPQPIDYGEDQCEACKMMISDKRFGAELVTMKGKIYKYDAIECLIPEVIKNGEDHYKHLLVTDYNSPGTLIDGRKSLFLVSENRPSPMGGNLSAYVADDEIKAVESLVGGNIYNWKQLIDKNKEISER